MARTPNASRWSTTGGRAAAHGGGSGCGSGCLAPHPLPHTMLPMLFSYTLYGSKGEIKSIDWKKGSK